MAYPIQLSSVKSVSNFSVSHLTAPKRHLVGLLQHYRPVHTRKVLLVTPSTITLSALPRHICKNFFAVQMRARWDILLCSLERHILSSYFDFLLWAQVPQLEYD